MQIKVSIAGNYEKPADEETLRQTSRKIIEIERNPSVVGSDFFDENIYKKKVRQ